MLIKTVNVLVYTLVFYLEVTKRQRTKEEEREISEKLSAYYSILCVKRQVKSIWKTQFNSFIAIIPGGHG